MTNKAMVGRFDGILQTVAFTDGETVSQLLSRANLSLGVGEAINDDSGEVVLPTETAISEMCYYIVGNFKQGY